NAGPEVTQSFTINKAESTTAVSVGSVIYDGHSHGATAGATGFGGLNQTLTVTYAGRNSTVYGPSTTAPANAGDYTASASFGGDANHSASSGSANFSIGKAGSATTVVCSGAPFTYNGQGQGCTASWASTSSGDTSGGQVSPLS